MASEGLWGVPGVCRARYGIHVLRGGSSPSQEPLAALAALLRQPERPRLRTAGRSQEEAFVGRVGVPRGS